MTCFLPSVVDCSVSCISEIWNHDAYGLYRRRNVQDVFIALVAVTTITRTLFNA